MSYLMKCEKGLACTNGNRKELESGAHRFNIKWRSISGQVIVNPLGGVILYKRHSAIGNLLSANHESERHFVVKAIQKHGENWNRAYEWIAF